jgi:hypothetical protein
MCAHMTFGPRHGGLPRRVFVTGVLGAQPSRLQRSPEVAPRWRPAPPYSTLLDPAGEEGFGPPGAPTPKAQTRRSIAH